MIRGNGRKTFEDIAEREDVTAICDSNTKDETIVYTTSSDSRFEDYVVKSIGGRGIVDIPPNENDRVQKYMIAM